MHQVSLIAVGGGLAGTTLAWALRRRGLSFTMIDKAEAVTSSRVAAGLMTPITGKRLTKTWRHDDLFPFAADFYRSVEAETGASFYHPRSIVRIFSKPSEAAKFAARRHEFGDLVRDPEPPLDAAWFRDPPGGFEMPTAAQLDVPAYLDASRLHFEKCGRSVEGDVSPEDVRIDDSGVSLPRFGLRAEHIVFCQGFAAARNPLTEFLPFRAAKGEILTVRMADFPERRILNDGHWLAPCGPDLWRFGATYSWDDLTNDPTVAGLSELEIALGKMLDRSFEVVDQQAAVRPIVEGRRPVLGFRSGSRVGVFNGLGSKGALLAPFFAAQLADAIAGLGTLDPDVDVRLRCI